MAHRIWSAWPNGAGAPVRQYTDASGTYLNFFYIVHLYISIFLQIFPSPLISFTIYVRLPHPLRLHHHLYEMKVI